MLPLIIFHDIPRIRYDPNPFDEYDTGFSILGHPIIGDLDPLRFLIKHNPTQEVLVNITINQLNSDCPGKHKSNLAVILTFGLFNPNHLCWGNCEQSGSAVPGEDTFKNLSARSIPKVDSVMEIFLRSHLS